MRIKKEVNMFVIASNITTRDSRIARVFRQARATAWNPDGEAAGILKEQARQCVLAGADALEVNLQQHFDSLEAMEFVVEAVQRTTDCQLCLSANNLEALEAGLKRCKRPPLVNYISFEESRLRNMLPLIARYKAEVVLLVSDPVSPADARDMVRKAAILVGAANETGITNERILIDPGLVHITGDVGQRHLTEIVAFLETLPDVFEPRVRSACWLANASSGAPRRLRTAIETTLLAMLSGLKLSSVFLDTLRRDNQRTLRLLEVFNNERVYASGEIDL
ncbi:MAG: dihydropteroate synthase [Chloroflexi bacterium]|nr:dihydropteroate synthase [Chloroflexota bacterium]